MRLLIITQKVDCNDHVLGFFHAWIETFARQVEQVEVMCLEEGEHHLPNNVSVHSLGKEGGRSRLKYLFRFYHLIFLLRHRYDTVFVHMNPEYVVLGAPLWRLWKKKVGLWYAHGAVSRTLRVAEVFSHYIFTSTKEGFRLKSDKVHVVHQGIDTSLFHTTPEHTAGIFTLIAVGRISVVKRYDRAIEVVRLLAEKGMPVVLWIVGGTVTDSDMHHERELKGRVMHDGLSERVHFLGPRTHAELPALFAKADALVHVSETGSLDKTVLEAMACGVPVVSSSEAVRTILPKETHELLCAPPNAEDIAHHLEKLLALPEFDRMELGAYLRRVVTHDHSLEGLVAGIISKYSNR